MPFLNIEIEHEEDITSDQVAEWLRDEDFQKEVFSKLVGKLLEDYNLQQTKTQKDYPTENLDYDVAYSPMSIEAKEALSTMAKNDKRVLIELIRKELFR
jgi:hypothetical protein